MKSFSIALGSNGGEIQSDVINGLIGRLLKQDIHFDGLDEITFGSFKNNVGKLN